ncbi:hypothetical protein ABEB36_005383 [Hypothenemus hampei]|uniref:Enoyl-CoA hydratase n=1 Tax=Hypothenemus hampei TaxID=57062 RepID=A0ABD1EY24_HYPHA
MFNKRIINLIFKNMSTITGDNTVLVDKIGGITTIAINRPKQRNCINSVTAKMLEEAITNFENDDGSFAAVLYGTGGNFCSGFDLNEIEGQCDSNTYINHSILASRKSIKKPMVAALNGYTVAGGLELALLCDLRVMEETAILGLYGRRFGVPLVDGGTVRLPAIIGLSRALDLILTGRSVTAKEAFEWGMINRIVACGTSLGQAMQLATCLKKFPQECLRSDRDSTYNAAFLQAYNDILKYEKQNASKVPIKKMIEGAKKFFTGIGKHGKFYDLTEKRISDWEKEYSQTAKSKL